MPEGVSVAITSLDLTGSAFASAQAKVQAFQKTTNYSMREAQASARLFNEEISANMSRHLTTIMAQSSLLGPALAAGMPIAAAAAFYEVVSRVGTALGKWYFNVEGLKEMQAAMDSATKRFVAFNDATMRIQKEAADVGISGQQKWAMELDVATEKVTQQKKALVDLSNSIYFLKNGMRQEIGGNTAADLPMLQARELANTQELAQSKAEQTRAQSELTKAQDEAMSEYQKQIEAATEKAKKHEEELAKSLVTILKMVDAFPLVQGGAYNVVRAGGSGPPSPGYTQSQAGLIDALSKQFSTVSDYGLHGTDPSDANAQKRIQQLQDQAGWFDATRTMAEKYDAAMKQLNSTFADSDKTNDLYLRSQKQIRETFDESTIKSIQAAAAQKQAWKQLGSEIEDQLLNAAFMKESWGKALSSILEDIAKLIIKMYVLDAISKSVGEDGGVGGGIAGFFSGLIRGIFGGMMASGGYANAGMSYLVGEKGPELFTPGSSGSISPSGSFGGVTHVHNYDLRGADVGVEQRLLRLFPIVEERAVIRAMNGTQERQLRR